ncbi:TrmB family transcriptional regulator [Halobaculum sp. WSA2]|uniref:TrmB family transcriptional regulator n=1 Tax=Halobaculum saliterrae TaxID=2073113 RepID=A0A6B0SZ88_9EURY|nr:helix-turn-helix domain-containing protein [Halobaculum saliterrae]MXR41861.1 TrmB family transcriptional regulator [Halobaculum saliterrae]
MSSHDAEALLDPLDLTEYEERALEHLLELGRTTAPDLSEATGIPKARIYGVLDELADSGYLKVIPGRPKQYQPKPPEEILDRAVENRRQAYETDRARIEDAREEFVAAFGPLYEQASEDISPTEELFHVVDVGDPSERETRTLYAEAQQEVRVITKSFEYFDAIEPAFADAYDRDRTLRVLFLDPELLEPANRSVQREIVEYLRSTYPAVKYRFSATRLPWRGTLIDPSLEYDSGDAVLLVEEEDVPLHKRQAAVTENHSFVAGLGRYFDLTWNHDTLDTDPYDSG